MTHAWCSDVTRDAAVRAAEDGRDRPLPTLGECIDGMFPKSGSASSGVEHENKGVRMTKSDRQAADYRAEAIARPFADAAERSSTVSETGEGQSGMRTERVVLEVTHFGPESAASWEWKYHIRPRHIFESVRVVELSERHAEFVSSATWQAETAERERDAAIRERDAAKARLADYENDDDLVRERSQLKARVAELEAAAKLASHANADGEANHAAEGVTGDGNG
jgi:hypothetical protein